MKKEEIYASLNRAYFSENSDEQGILDRLAPMVKECKCFLDIGASLGQYTRYANELMTNGTIFTIEADPVRFEELERNCAKWSEGSSNRLVPVHAAVCDNPGDITFFTTNSNVSGGLFPHPVKSDGVEWEEITVPGITLDDYFKETVPDFIKMDVEGGELRALKGARRILDEKATTLFVEVHSWADPQGQNDQYEVYEFMEGLGYGMTRIEGRSLFKP